MSSGLKVIAPATISNLNCGYDILGLATELVADEIIARKTTRPGVVISQVTGPGKQGISLDPSLNTAGRAAQSFFDYTRIRDAGIDLEIHKHIPAGSGLGSSASSACAAVVVADALFKTRLSQLELIAIATIGEFISCKSFHADNVAPCLMGGIILIRDLLMLDIHRLHVPKGLWLTIVRPDMQILTSDARGVLNKNVQFKKSIKQGAALGSLVLGLERGDMKLIAASMQDHLVEPQRAHLIPGFEDLRSAAYRAGALSFGISGSGPTVFALSQNTTTAEIIGESLTKVFSESGTESQFHISTVSHQGTQLM